MIRIGTIYLLLCTLLSPPIVHGFTGQEVVDRVRERLGKAEAISLEFKRTLYWKMADMKEEVEGTLFLLKPGKFRLETPVQVMVTDGQTMWSYSAENEQVIVSRYHRSDDPSSPERILFEYSENHTAAYVGEEKVRKTVCDVVRLTPKEKDSNIAWMKVWVDRKEGMTLKMQFVDVNENEITYELSTIKMDPKLPEAAFRFDIPEGVDVVDMR